MVSNPNKYSEMNTGTSLGDIRDNDDFPHTGLIKALSSGMGQNYAISGFDASSINATAVTIAAGVIFKDGEMLACDGASLTLSSSYSTGYHLLVAPDGNSAANRAVVLRAPTAAGKVNGTMTAGDTIIAVLAHTGSNPMQIQYLTVDKDSNSLSIGHDDSGYTESGNITGDANSIDIVSTPSNADINLVPNGTGKVGVGTASPATKLHVVGGTTPIVRVDGGNNNGTTAVDNNIQGVEISKYGMNQTNKYGGGYKFTSTDSSFTTHNPKMLAAMVHRALQTYSADNNGNSAIDFFIHDGTTTDGAGPASVKHTMTSSALGIGTDAPDTELHVKGATSPELRLQEDGNDGYTSLVAYSDSYGGLAVRDNAGSESTILDIDVESAGTGAQTLRLFRTSNASATSTKFQILSAGTTTEVFRVAADDGDTTIAQSLKLSVTSQDGYIDNIIDDKDIIFRASTSSATNEIMRVDSTQQAVSIGTATSNAKLTVDGDISRKGLIRNVTTVIGASGPPTPLPVYSVLDTDDLIIASAPSGGSPPNSLDVQLPDAAAEDIGRTYRIVAIDVAAGLAINRTGSDDVFVDEVFAPISLPFSLSLGKVYDITCVDANKWMVMTLN